MTQYALRHGDETIYDYSWTSVADVIAAHATWADNHRLPGTLLTRPGDNHEWTEAYPLTEQNVWAAERADVLARFSAELERATGDGSKKRQAGIKPPWHLDDSHEAAMFSHLMKWKRGELTDPDSGAHPLVHLAWRALGIACRETGNVPAHFAASTAVGAGSEDAA